MTTTHDVPMPEPAFKLKWRDARYYVSEPEIGDTDCYTADQVRDTAIKYADARCAKLQEERDALRKLIDSPELHDFARGAVLEAAHQVERWGTDHDSGKTPADWFWLVGYLAGKALHAQTSGNTEKALHHTISTAAALANWHRAINGANDMRPGIDPPIDDAIDAAGGDQE